MPTLSTIRSIAEKERKPQKNLVLFSADLFTFLSAVLGRRRLPDLQPL